MAREEPSQRERRLARRTLAAGATLLPIGLAMVGIGPSDAGTGVTLIAILTLGYGVHAFGRLGPDDGDE